MALGTHWEWRGFGIFSDAFRRRFECLEDLFPSQSIVDEYIWVPDLPINLKLRRGTGGQDGLKFKRPGRTIGDLEEWHEDPSEIHDFPLSTEAWESLRREFADVSIILPPFPDEPLDRDLTFDTLRRSDSNIRVVAVTKARVTKLWSGPEGDVRVEVTEISSPEEVTCLGLESSAGEGGEPADEVARSALRSARTVLGIDREGLEVMNYLQALNRWVRVRQE
ncbi:MAG: hypothetical protein V3T24_11215 [Longimicrobiales bacterium]